MSNPTRRTPGPKEASAYSRDGRLAESARYTLSLSSAREMRRRNFLCVPTIGMLSWERILM